MSKSSKIIIALLVVIFIAILGVGGYVILKMNDKIGEQSNQIANLNGKATTSSSKDEGTSNKSTTENIVNSNTEYYSSNSQNNTNDHNSYGNNNSTNSNGLVINQEGSEVQIDSKKYVSQLGYSMRYDYNSFNVSYHDNGDWYKNTDNIGLVIVEKEDTSYERKITTLSNYQRTTVNGLDAVYTTRTAEGELEIKYYVNAGNGKTYIITTCCPNNSEYIEGIGSIIKGMVQTFSIN